MSNNTLPSAWLPIDASAAGVSVFASEQWITPPKKQNPFDRRRVHHEQLTSLQQNLSLQCWIMKKQPLWQVQWLQLPAWDNCKSFQTRPESCGSLSVSPWEHQVQQSEISTQDCWQWFTMSQFNHICLTFSKPKPKLQPRSNVTVWCLGSSRSLLRRFCLCLPEGTSTFQRDRMTTMASLKNTKAYTWEKWIPSLFSSVAVSGSFALVSTYQHLFAIAASAGAAGVSVAYPTHFWKGFYAHKLPKDVSCHSKVTGHTSWELALSAKAHGELWSLQ